MAVSLGSCPLSLISVVVQNGPERSRARGFCAAKRTLDGEDRSGRWGRRERGRGRRGTPRGVWGSAPIPKNKFAYQRHRIPTQALSVTDSCSQPIKEHLPDRRIMASGDTEYWLDVFTDNPQMAAAHEAGANWMLRVAVYTIYTGQNAGKAAGPIAVLWLKAFGCGAITAPGPGSDDYSHPLVNPNKFSGLLPEIWRWHDNAIFEVPSRSYSLAHVIPKDKVVMRQPVNGLDVEAVGRYVDALNDPHLPLARLRWDTPDHGSIVTSLQPSQIISLQITYDPGWRAYSNGHRAKIGKDGLGMMSIDPDCDGPCSVSVEYTGGWARAVCSVISGLAALGLFGCMVAPGSWVKRKAGIRRSGSLRPARGETGEQPPRDLSANP